MKADYFQQELKRLLHNFPQKNIQSLAFLLILTLFLDFLLQKNLILCFLPEGFHFLQKEYFHFQNEQLLFQVQKQEFSLQQDCFQKHKFLPCPSVFSILLDIYHNSEELHLLQTELCSHLFQDLQDISHRLLQDKFFLKRQVLLLFFLLRFQ